MAKSLYSQCSRSILSTISQNCCSPVLLLRGQFHTTSIDAFPVNRARGASALRRRPYRGSLSVSSRNFPLPEPVLDTEKHTKPQTKDDHGLWGFFNKDKVCFPTPDEDHKHGRAWSVWELRAKSWDDLHKLWWTCVKERNIIATQAFERERVKAGYGADEAEKRDKEIKLTQRAIKHVLTERWYAWEDSYLPKDSGHVLPGPLVKPKHKYGISIIDESKKGIVPVRKKPFPKTTQKSRYKRKT